MNAEEVDFNDEKVKEELKGVYGYVGSYRCGLCQNFYVCKMDAEECCAEEKE